MKEEWKAVPNTAYEASSLGRIRRAVHYKSTYVGRIIKGVVDRYGYEKVTIPNAGSKKNYCVHALVLMVFVGERPKKLITHHKDGNKLNNCLSNLEYSTVKENALHAVLHGRNHFSNQTHCKRGHPFSGNNLIIIPKRDRASYRQCRACRNMHMKKRDRRKRYV